MRGFTLIELLLVIAIVAILAAVPVATINSEEAQVDAAVRAVIADLLEAEALAMESCRPVGLKFYPDQERYEFILDDGRTPTDAEATLDADADLDPVAKERLLEVQPQSVDEFARVDLVTADIAGEVQVLFNPDGTVSKGGYLDVQLGEIKRRIRIQAGSGRITVTVP